MKRFDIVTWLIGAVWCFTGLVPPVTLAQSSGTYADLKWQSVGACYTTSNSPEYNAKLRVLGRLTLRGSDETVGCVTTPYLSPNYDSDCALGACSDVHAGVDLRARTPLPVYPIEKGKVLKKSFDLSIPHSTLIVENLAQTHKVFYLHMSEISVKEGDAVDAETTIGKTGDVGAPGNPHLHVEVWPSTSRTYCARDGAISGSACTIKKIEVLNPKSKKPESKTVCTLDEVTAFTIDPADVAAAADKDTPITSRRLTNDSRLLIDSLGPVRVGMTTVEAERALGGRLVVEEVEPGGCGYARPEHGPGGVSFMLSNRRVVRIDIDSCQIKADSGAQIGSTEAEVKNLYRDASYLVEEVGHQYDPNGHYLVVNVLDPKYQDKRVIFETDGERVTAMRSGKLPEVGYVEGCF